MKATELRIGNYLTLTEKQRKELWHNQIWAQNAFFEVTCIWKDEDISLELDEEIVDFEIKDVSPIPLTEEWLLKFGFEKLAFSFICDRFHITKQDNSDYWFTASNKNNAFINKIKYVHSLQNLFFTLNNEELQYSAQ